MPVHTFSIHALNRRIAAELPYRGRVVDLGCGEAPYRGLILDRGATEYVGVDWPRSQHRTDKVDVLADLSARLPFDDGYADTVVAFQVMEHLPDPSHFLAEAHRILRPGGQIHLTTPFMWQVHEAPDDYYRYTIYGLEYLLRSAGFRQINVRANTGFWLTWVLKLSYHVSAMTPRPLRPVWWPWWYVLQRSAPWLDRLDPDDSETASYTASAVR